MRKLTVEEQLSVLGGARWACKTCGYLSNDHIFYSTASDMAYAHKKKYKGHETVVRA
ncbi:hypothetical protein HPA28_06625 [Streptococcus suis]|uniref:hypothetical protein n=1 Tax=Streptococcus orisratti TaxID=114652 RepID=UPI001552B564|nr:hypothetical protein [Streptococcus suis]NQO39321.1 hypothetical protein [Streptococcus suis]NQP23474.1 hypothetical protein [Streptococcus suis]NQP24696.1 hypothetical protein [Streptococcus suis]